jgi:hypothetical protein
MQTLNFKICILNIHILPTHVKTHNTVYDFHELFLKIIKSNLDIYKVYDLYFIVKYPYPANPC